GGGDPRRRRLLPGARPLRLALRRHGGSDEPAAPGDHGAHRPRARAHDRDVLRLRADLPPQAPVRGSGRDLLIDTEPLVEVEGVSHHFGTGALRKQILFDIALAVAPGEIVILTGPSGSGKTTLLTLIGGLRSCRAGRLRVLGHELRDAPESVLVRVRRQIGYIFQLHNLLDALTASQNVQMSLRGERGL